MTRQKILDTATDVFGELGYQAVTVRDIVKRAGVNQSAVNYHFRSKESLYSETVKQALSRTSFLDDITQKIKHLPPDKRLYAFMRKTIEALHGFDDHGSRFSRLIARELAEPSGISGFTVECHAFAYDTMRQILPTQTPESRIKFSALWLLAQSSVIGRLIQKTAQEQQIPGADIDGDLFDFSFDLFYKGLLDS